MAAVRVAVTAVGLVWLAATGSADVRADLEVIKLFSKTGEGSLTLMYSDFSANIMANGGHNNVCAWDVCRGNRQGLKFSNGEEVWSAGEGSRVGSMQVMTPVHNVKFSKFCARSYDYDPDDDTWWISKGFSAADGRVKDNDIGYIEIEGLHDFCAVDADKFKAGAKLGTTPSPIKHRKLLEDDIFDELKRIQANLNSMSEEKVLVELATIKKRASRAAGLAEQILPIMREIYAGLGGKGGGSSGGTRQGTVKVSPQRKSARVMGVVLGAAAVFGGCVLLAMYTMGGASDGKPSTKKTPATPAEEKKKQ